MLWAEGAGLINGCTFDAPKEAVFVELSGRQEHIAGALRTVECVFRRCNFKGVGILGTREMIEKWKASN